MSRTVWFAQRAWDGDRIVKDVTIEVEDGLVAAVSLSDPPVEARHLGGVVLPGLVNAHSHAFHRALRGRTHAAGGDFWRWRELMYGVARGLDPDGYRALARGVYAEMLLAGITCVGEFHYLHHDRDGSGYGDPNEMGLALVEAARDVGIRITLLDTAYLRAGLVDAPLDPVQRRFADRGIDAWAERVESLVAGLSDPTAKIGVGAHSVRALDPHDIAEVTEAVRRLDVPLHFHLSEQAAENEGCLARHGRTPAAVMADAGALEVAATAVHATHLTDGDIRLLGEARTSICLCPTTERDLGDGIGPALELVESGCSLSLGSDSHAVVDLFEEARAVELDDRLRLGLRGIHDPKALLRAATTGGGSSLGWPLHGIREGALADFIAVRTDTVRLAGLEGAGIAPVVFGAAACDVTDVIVGGEHVVAGGRHRTIEAVPAELTAAIGAALP